MAVTKRARYEVLRRDGHRCRYCGAGADQSPLTVDHVVPSSLGGSDDPSNLVAACRDCNAGKSSSNPDARAVAQVADDAMRWGAAMEKAAENYAAERRRREDDLARFEVEWSSWRAGRSAVPIDDGWRSSLTAMLAAGLPLDEAIGLVRVAMESKATSANKFRYFCGCAWTVVRQLQEEARKYVGCPDPAPSQEPERCGHCVNCLYIPDDDCVALSGIDESEYGEYEPCPECGERTCLYGMGYANGVQQGEHHLAAALSDLRSMLLSAADDPRLVAYDAANKLCDAGAELYEIGFPGDSLGIFIDMDDVTRVARIFLGPERYSMAAYDLDVNERADKTDPFGATAESS